MTLDGGEKISYSVHVNDDFINSLLAHPLKEPYPLKDSNRKLALSNEDTLKLFLDAHYPSNTFQEDLMAVFHLLNERHSERSSRSNSFCLFSRRLH